MPHIIVEMYPGRDEDAKLKLAESVAENVSSQLGLRKEAVSVSIKEIPKEDWKSKVYDKVVKDENKEVYIKPGYDM